MQKILLRSIFCISLSIILLLIAANAQKSDKAIVRTDNKNAIIKKDEKLSEFEKEIFAEVNNVRVNPAQYVRYLEEIRKSMTGKIRFIPPDIRLLTLEGIESVDDAIAKLKEISAATPYKLSKSISKAARKHLLELAENPKLGHFGTDGSDPMDRINSVNVFPNKVGENIVRDADTAREIVLRMIIDDGTKARSHRKNLFSEKFDTIGIAYGIAKNGQQIVVVDFADLPEPKADKQKSSKQN